MSKLYVTESGHHAIGYAEFGFWQSFVLDAMQTSTDSAWDYYVVRNRTIICFTVLFTVLKTSTKPSVLWHCWLGVRKSIWPVKSDEVLVWLSVWSKVQIVCILSSWCHCIQNPVVFCLSEIQTGFYLSYLCTLCLQKNNTPNSCP